MDTSDIVFAVLYIISGCTFVFGLVARKPKPKSFGFLHCCVLCFREGNELLGIDDEDFWLPACIDLSAIKAIKKNGGANEEYADCSVIYHGSDYFVIDIHYEEAVRVWINFKQK